MLVTLFASTLLYAGCFGFFHADKRRSAYQAIKSNANLQKSVLGASWLLIISAFVAFCSTLGPERGVPVWLGGVTLAAAANLLIAALFPKPHVISGAVSLVGIFLSGIGIAIGALS
ncbi:MAG: hypothetical protein AAF720_10435 [Pseudomonadota bacterium]